MGVSMLNLGKSGAGQALNRVVNAWQIELSGSVRDGIHRHERERSRRPLSGGPDVKERSRSGIAEERGLHVCLCAFERDVTTERMHGVESGSVEERAHLELSCFRIRGQILQIGNTQKEFEHAAAEVSLRFLIRGGLRQRCRSGNFAIEAAEYFFHHRSFTGAQGVLAMLGPITDAAFALRPEDLNASDGDLRKDRRFFFHSAQAKNCFRKQNFLAGAATDKKHPFPASRFPTPAPSSIHTVPPPT